MTCSSRNVILELLPFVFLKFGLPYLLTANRYMVLSIRNLHAMPTRTSQQHDDGNEPVSRYNTDLIKSIPLTRGRQALYRRPATVRHNGWKEKQSIFHWFLTDS